MSKSDDLFVGCEGWLSRLAPAEVEALKAMQAAFQACEVAERRCSDAGYGSEVMSTMFAASQHIEHAVKVVMGRT